MDDQFLEIGFDDVLLGHPIAAARIIEHQHTRLAQLDIKAAMRLAQLDFHQAFACHDLDWLR